MSDQGRKPLQGAMIFAIIALALLGGAYAIWPPGFFGTPFAEMPAAMLLRTSASAALAMIGIEFLGALAIVSITDD
jgi:hypothetical protein